MKVKLPGVNGNISVNLPFLLTAVVNLSAAEPVVVTCVSTVVQCWPRKDAKFKFQQMAFNVSMMAFASCLASLMFHADGLRRMQCSSSTLGLALKEPPCSWDRRLRVAAIVAVSEGKAAGQIWWSLAHLSFPYYVVSAGVTSMVQAVSSHLEWGLALAVFPVMYGIHRSYRMYFEKAEVTRKAPLARASGVAVYHGGAADRGVVLDVSHEPATAEQAGVTTTVTQHLPLARENRVFGQPQRLEPPFSVCLAVLPAREAPSVSGSALR